MSYKPVAPTQLDHVGKLAKDKGIDSKIFQDAFLDSGVASRFFDGIKNGLPIAVGTPTIVPRGCRVYTLRVKVWLDQPWGDAVNVVGADTPENDNIRKVIDLYPPTGEGIVDKTLVLLNYANGGGSWDKALEWATPLPLRRTSPRDVFAIGAQHPNFHRDVGLNPTYVVAIEDCTFDGHRRTCCVRWHDSNRRAILLPVDYFGCANDCFAFWQV